MGMKKMIGSIILAIIASQWLMGCSTTAQKAAYPDQHLAPAAPDHRAETRRTSTREIPPATAVHSEPVDLWDRLRRGMDLPAAADNALVQQYVQWHRENPSYLHRVTERGEPFLYFILDALEQRNMPSELLLLPIVESAYQPFAYSHGRAAGLWQFIPSTGRHFGLHQTWWYDGRRDVYASTQAALDYLQQLHARFDNDWLLALAAYNAGQGTVHRAITRNAERGLTTDYWHLDLPRETRHYVPKLLALKIVMTQPEYYGIELAPVSNSPQITVVELDFQLELAVAAELAGLEMDQLHQLNPGFNRWATPPDGPHRLLLPIEHANQFSQALTELDPNARVSWQRHHIQQGDTLGGISRQYQISVADLRRINGLSGDRIRAGRYLLIPSQSDPAMAARVASANRPLNIPANRITHVVRTGDNLWNLARRHGVTVADLTRWNNLRSDSILRPGQRLVLYVDVVAQGR
ncbi:membrane-bound lytic murein transglycosylase D [Ectothiorhodosinus mongolicus]|uniref:Membrane-bound lytic murein transglycosylase D n=2 Tax=Ectothiorhodosinus mongolicus TaxID=233100 RepID=A0A1R3VSY6_9GAMM|nr:lytic transglycosylase [Ectothiorhodosinus mongolicus]SIT66316.1 membrane-bound lytic murein transglycosylase D [Ectothiorhodosinus mongolicus]